MSVRRAGLLWSGLVSAALLLWMPAPLLAQYTASVAADSAEYRTLSKRVAAGDTTADFTRLRKLYATLPSSDKEPVVAPESLFAHARRAADPRAARAAIDSVLAMHFGNVRAHEVAERVYRARGDSVDAAREAALVRQFAASIMRGRDGLTVASAFVVYGIPEEYTVLRAMGVKMQTQALISCDGLMCDVLTGTEEKTGKSVSYYFQLPKAF